MGKTVKKAAKILTVSEDQTIAAKTCRDVFPEAATQMQNGQWDLDLNHPIAGELQGTHLGITTGDINSAARGYADESGAWLFKSLKADQVSTASVVNDVFKLIVGNLKQK